MKISEIASRYDRWFRADLGRHADRMEKELGERFNQRVFRPFRAFMLAVEVVTEETALRVGEKSVRVNKRTDEDMQVM